MYTYTRWWEHLRQICSPERTMLIGYTRTNMNGETDPRDFEQFMLRRKRAAAAYVSGDFRPLGEIAACELSATFPVPVASM